MILQKLKKRVSNQSSGQAIIEFTLVFLLFIFVILGVFEFARMLQVWLTIQFSAQEGARYAATGQQSVDPTEDLWDSVRLEAIKEEVRNRASSLNIDDSADAFSPGYFNVSVYASDPPASGQEFPGGPNARVIVDVVHNHQLMTPLLSAYFPYVQLRAHAEKINERFRHPGFGTPPGSMPPTVMAPTATFTPSETPTPSFTPTETPTPTDTPFGAPTATFTSPPIPTNTLTLTPTLTPGACPIVASDIITSSSDKVFKFNMTNNSWSSYYISSITISWPDENWENDDLDRIVFKGNVIYNTDISDSPATIYGGWILGSWSRRLESGTTRTLAFYFDDDALSTGYTASVSFWGLWCTVDVVK